MKEALLDDVGLLLTLAGVTAVTNLSATMADCALSPRSHTVLRLAAERPGITQSEVAERLSLSPSRVVAIVDELESHRFLERLVDPLDRRARGLIATPQGMDELAASAPAVARALEHTLAGLDLAEREELHVLLRRLVVGLSRIERSPQPGERTSPR